jgi:hypothetical protein
LRALIVAFAAPRKGSPKWAALFPIAVEIVGHCDLDYMRQELARLRKR